MKRLMHLLVKELQFILLLTLLFVFAMFQGGFVSWFLFYSMLPILLYLMVIPIYPFKKWKVTRTLSDRYLATGGKVEVTITIQRKYPFPIFFLLLEDLYPETLRMQNMGKKQYQYLSDRSSLKTRTNFKRVVHLGFRRKIQVSYVLDHLPRGKHQLAPMRITFGDTFGFIDVAAAFQDVQTFYVYPSVQSMKWRISAHSAEEGTTSAQVMNDRLSNVVSGIREYTPGDRVSWIDWKATARKNVMMTKEFEQEKDANITILLDISLASNNPIVFDASIQWTVSALHLLKKNGQQVSFLTLGEERRLFTNHQLHTQFTGVQNYLATITPENTSWLDNLQKYHALIPKGSVYIMIIRSLDRETVERLLSWGVREYMMICYITPQSQLDQMIEAGIRKLRQRQIRVQIVTEEQLVQAEWEVAPT